jgi:DnaA family protein
MKGAQLALPVQLSQAPAFDNFFAGPNADVVASLQGMVSLHGLPAAWLYGAAASGKSHLLRATVALAGPRALYAAAPYEERTLADWNDANLLALDDVEALAADEDSAIALLRLVDHRRQHGLPLLLAAGVPPARLDSPLLDLRTRLDAMALLGLKPLRDDDRRELVGLHAAQRGLELPQDAMAWLLGHLRRDAGTLIAALEEIDRACLSAKRRPTLPFVQQALAPLLQPSLLL